MISDLWAKPRISIELIFKFLLRNARVRNARDDTVNVMVKSCITWFCHAEVHIDGLPRDERLVMEIVYYY